jgi:hypothetical protein
VAWKAKHKTVVSTKASTWEHDVGELAGIAPKYPHTAYTGLQKSLQNEWQFVQRVKPGIGDHFHRVKVALATKFLPALFGESIDADGDPRRILASLPVKHAGLAIPNLTDSASSCYEASTLVCSHLMAAIREVVPFSNATHQGGRRDDIAELQKRKNLRNDEDLSRILTPLPCHKQRHLKGGQVTGAWLNVIPSTINGTELSAPHSLCKDNHQTCRRDVTDVASPTQLGMLYNAK